MRFLFVDRILALTEGKTIQGIKHVTSDDTYLCEDVSGSYFFMPSLIGEAVGQLAAWNVMLTNGFKGRPVAGVVQQAIMHRPVWVGETVLLEAFIDALDEEAVSYHGRASVNGDIVFELDAALGPILSMDTFIDEAVVRSQFDEIYRPGSFEEVQASMPLEMVIEQDTIRPMRCMFDGIVEHVPGQAIIAQKKITSASAYFRDHFPKSPVLPMTVLLECKRHLACLFLQQACFDTSYQVWAFNKIKMNTFVRPGDTLVCHMHVQDKNEERMILRSRSEVNGRRVCVADIILKAMR